MFMYKRTANYVGFTRCWKGVDMLQTSAKRKYLNTCQTSVGQVYQTVRKGIEGSGLLLSWHGSWGAGGSYEE